MDAGELWSIGDYATIGELWSAPGRELAASLDVAGCDVIDVATGTGVTALEIARRGARSVVGVDASAKMLAEAAVRAANAKLEIDWIEADFASIPLPDESADLVVSTFGLMFASDPGAAFGEARRLLRPGGELIFTSWAASGFFGRLFLVMSKHFPERPTPWHESPEGIRALLGDDARVEEHSFPLSIESPEWFVSQLEQFSAPFMVAIEGLGPKWSAVRSELVESVTEMVAPADVGYSAEVHYLTTTL